jgi:exodeoxyribonuclease VII large subunit
MPPTYLSAPYKDRAQVKALGARWDGESKRWYVPDGLDLQPFTAWLAKGGLTVEAVAGTAALVLRPDQLPNQAGAVALAQERGLSLSVLLMGVADLVSQAYRAGVWTRVEVLKADLRSGHVYLEIGERNSLGNTVAQARAMIWASTAVDIVPAFERATGVVLGAGIKLLVRVKPTIHPVYGMSLVIEGIDPEYTLGDLEAKKREIRERLQREGLFDVNKRLPAPWDYNAVLVVAPQEAAGLGDFRAEAERLQALGICEFVYVVSRFQGEGAAAEIRAAMLAALSGWRGHGGKAPDALVLIRGGGAVNDLAWLNDYELARCICELPVPVLTGIGHERDSTLLDEVAHAQFDTPSKVILGVEQLIGRRSAEAAANFEAVARAAAQMTASMRRALDLADAAVKSGAERQVAAARQTVAEWMAEVRIESHIAVRTASDAALQQFQQLSQSAREQLAAAKQWVPELLSVVRAQARQVVREARSETRVWQESVLERSTLTARRAREDAERALAEVALGARRVTSEAATGAQALLREIAGQGPDKTLGRGFAIVRGADGQPITRADQVSAEQAIEIQFRDGRVAARL